MGLDWGAEIRTANLRDLVQDTGLGPGVGPVSTCSSFCPPMQVTWLCQCSSKTGEEREDTTSDGFTHWVTIASILGASIVPVSGTAMFKGKHQNLWLQGTDNRAKGANMNQIVKSQSEDDYLIKVWEMGKKELTLISGTESGYERRKGVKNWTNMQTRRRERRNIEPQSGSQHICRRHDRVGHDLPQPIFGKWRYKDPL